MEVSILSPSENEKWDDFVISHPFSSIYHLSCWSKILSETFSYVPRYLLYKDDKGNIEAALPFMLINSWATGKRLVSLPKVPFCDPLISQSHLPLLLDYLNRSVANGEINYCEIRTHNDNPLFAGAGFIGYRAHYNHVLDLDRSPNYIWESFDRSCVKQRINKAIKYGVKVREGTDTDDLKVFFALYKNTARKHVIPIKPFRYFSGIWEAFFPRNQLTLLIAEAHGEPAAASLSFSFKDTMYYEYLGLNYRLSDLCPGQLLVWELIQRAHAKGLKNLDFGVSEKRNRGLIDYKKRWGAKASEAEYFYFPDAKGYKAFIKSIEYQKDMERKSIVNQCLNHFSRIIAQVFYKHFG